MLGYECIYIARIQMLVWYKQLKHIIFRLHQEQGLSYPVSLKHDTKIHLNTLYDPITQWLFVRIDTYIYGKDFS